MSELDKIPLALFNKLEVAIKEGNLSAITALCNHMRLLDSPEDVLRHQNEDGDTLLHMMLKTGNLDVYNASTSYESGFWTSMDIKNKSGNTPLDEMSKLPEEYNYWKEEVINSFSPSYSQSFILSQMRLYLTNKMENDPENYKKEDVIPINNSLVPGHCLGFTTIWGHYMLNGNEQEFIDTFKKVVSWDGKNITPEIEKAFEIAISNTRFVQVSGLENKEKVEWRNESEKNKGTEPGELIWITQKAYEITINDAKYKTEHSEKKVNDLSKDDFREFIAVLCENSKAGKMVSLIANNHNIALFCKDNKVNLYDSNYQFKLVENPSEASIPFVIKEKADYDLIADAIVTRLYKVFGKDTTNINMEINVIGNIMHTPSEFPDIEEVKFKHVFKHTLKNFQDREITPNELYKYIQYNDEYLTKDQRDILCKSIKLDTRTLNVIEDDGYNITSPLSKAIMLNDATLVKLYIDNGADLNLKVDYGTPLEIAKFYCLPEIIKVIEGSSQNPSKQSVKDNKSVDLKNNDLDRPNIFQKATDIGKDLIQKEAQKKEETPKNVPLLTNKIIKSSKGIIK